MVTIENDGKPDEDSSWYLDTGCSNHMIGRRDWLVDFDACVKNNVRFACYSILTSES
jgi:hypothetical protein